MKAGNCVLDNLRSGLVEVLAPHLYEETPTMSYSGGKYICLHVRNTAFMSTPFPHPFPDTDNRHGWHIHIKDSSQSDDVHSVLRYLKPDLHEALMPTLFRWKLEGGT